MYIYKLVCVSNFTQIFRKNVVSSSSSKALPIVYSALINCFAYVSLIVQCASHSMHSWFWGRQPYASWLRRLPTEIALFTYTSVAEKKHVSHYVFTLHAGRGQKRMKIKNRQFVLYWFKRWLIPEIVKRFHILWFPLISYESQ